MALDYQNRDTLLDDPHLGQTGKVACETKIKFRDVFHLKNLYRFMHEWLINDGWGSHEDLKWPEVFFMSKQRADGEEIWFWWRLSKFGYNKESRYFKKIMDVDVHVLYLKTEEVIINGQKVKANNGEVEIIIRGRLATDPDKQWQNHWFLKHFHDFYWKRLMKTEIDQQKQELYQDCYKFHGNLKTFFRLYQVEPDRQPFRAPSGMETK